MRFTNSSIFTVQIPKNQQEKTVFSLPYSFWNLAPIDIHEQKYYNISKARSSTQAIGTSEVRPALDGVRGHTESVRTCLEPAQASIIGEDLRIDCRKAWPQKAAAADVRQWVEVLSSGPFL